MTTELTHNDVVAVTSYANADMRLVKGAELAGVDYRTLSVRLDGVYRKTKLDPKNFRDLTQLIHMIEETQ